MSRKINNEKLACVLASASWLAIISLFFGGIGYLSGSVWFGLSVGFVAWFMLEFTEGHA